MRLLFLCLLLLLCQSTRAMDNGSSISPAYSRRTLVVSFRYCYYEYKFLNKTRRHTLWLKKLAYHGLYRFPKPKSKCGHRWHFRLTPKNSLMLTLYVCYMMIAFATATFSDPVTLPNRPHKLTDHFEFTSLAVPLFENSTATEGMRDLQRAVVSWASSSPHLPLLEAFQSYLDQFRQLAHYPVDMPGGGKLVEHLEWLMTVAYSATPGAVLNRVMVFLQEIHDSRHSSFKYTSPQEKWLSLMQVTTLQYFQLWIEILINLPQDVLNAFWLSVWGPACTDPNSTQDSPALGEIQRYLFDQHTFLVNFEQVLSSTSELLSGIHERLTTRAFVEASKRFYSSMEQLNRTEVGHSLVISGKSFADWSEDRLAAVGEVVLSEVSPYVTTLGKHFSDFVVVDLQPQVMNRVINPLLESWLDAKNFTSSTLAPLTDHVLSKIASMKESAGAFNGSELYAGFSDVFANYSQQLVIKTKEFSLQGQVNVAEFVARQTLSIAEASEAAEPLVNEIRNQLELGANRGARSVLDASWNTVLKTQNAAVDANDYAHNVVVNAKAVLESIDFMALFGRSIVHLVDLATFERVLIAGGMLLTFVSLVFRPIRMLYVVGLSAYLLGIYYTLESTPSHLALQYLAHPVVVLALTVLYFLALNFHFGFALLFTIIAAPALHVAASVPIVQYLNSLVDHVNVSDIPQDAYGLTSIYLAAPLTIVHTCMMQLAGFHYALQLCDTLNLGSIYLWSLYVVRQYIFVRSALGTLRFCLTFGYRTYELWTGTISSPIVTREAAAAQQGANGEVVGALGVNTAKWWVVATAQSTSALVPYAQAALVDAYESMPKCTIALTDSEARQLALAAGCNVAVTAKGYSGLSDHKLLAAMRELVRNDTYRKFDPSTIKVPTLVVGATLTDVRRSWNNPYIHFAVYDSEGKDAIRSADALNDINAILGPLQAPFNQQNLTHTELLALWMNVKIAGGAHRVHTIKEALSGKWQFTALLYPDSIYNLRDTDWANWFNATGAGYAHWYGMLPLELLPEFKVDVPNNPLYRLQHFIGAAGRINSLLSAIHPSMSAAKWITQDISWRIGKFPVYTPFLNEMVAMTYNGWENGYVHELSAWSTLLNSRVMNAGNVSLVVDIQARVGPMARGFIYRACKDEKPVPVTFALPEHMATVSIPVLSEVEPLMFGFHDIPNAPRVNVVRNDMDMLLKAMIQVEKSSLDSAASNSLANRHASGIQLLAGPLTTSWTTPRYLWPFMVNAAYVENNRANWRFAKTKAACNPSPTWNYPIFREVIMAVSYFPRLYRFFVSHPFIFPIVVPNPLSVFQVGYAYYGQQNWTVGCKPIPEIHNNGCEFCSTYDFGSQVVLCQHGVDQVKFSMTHAERETVRTDLMAKIEVEQTDLKAALKLCKSNIPLGDHTCKVIYLDGGPGAGKSVTIRSIFDYHRAQNGGINKGMVVSPVLKLGKEFDVSQNSNANYCFKTMHMAFGESGKRFLAFDEFQKTPAELIKGLIILNKPDFVIFAGDVKQTGVREGLHGQDPRVHFPMALLAKHTLFRNFRNGADVVAILNTVYGYITTCHRGMTDSCTIKVVKTAPNDGINRLCFTHSQATASAMGYATIDTCVGQSVDHALLHLDAQGAALHLSDEHNIVALSRHKKTLVIVSDGSIPALEWLARHQIGNEGFTGDYNAALIPAPARGSDKLSVASHLRQYCNPAAMEQSVPRATAPDNIFDGVTALVRTQITKLASQPILTPSLTVKRTDPRLPWFDGSVWSRIGRDGQLKLFYENESFLNNHAKSGMLIVLAGSYPGWGLRQLCATFPNNNFLLVDPVPPTWCPPYDPNNRARVCYIKGTLANLIRQWKKKQIPDAMSASLLISDLRTPPSAHMPDTLRYATDMKEQALASAHFLASSLKFRCPWEPLPRANLKGYEDYCECKPFVYPAGELRYQLFGKEKCTELRLWVTGSKLATYDPKILIEQALYFSVITAGLGSHGASLRLRTNAMSLVVPPTPVVPALNVPHPACTLANCHEHAANTTNACFSGHAYAGVEGRPCHLCTAELPPATHHAHKCDGTKRCGKCVLAHGKCYDANCIEHQYDPQATEMCQAGMYHNRTAPMKKCHLCLANTVPAVANSPWTLTARCSCLACYLGAPSPTGNGHAVFACSDLAFVDQARNLLEPLYELGKFVPHDTTNMDKSYNAIAQLLQESGHTLEQAQTLQDLDSTAGVIKYADLIRVTLVQEQAGKAVRLNKWHVTEMNVDGDLRSLYLVVRPKMLKALPTKFAQIRYHNYATNATGQNIPTVTYISMNGEAYVNLSQQDLKDRLLMATPTIPALAAHLCAVTGQAVEVENAGVDHTTFSPAVAQIQPQDLSFEQAYAYCLNNVYEANIGNLAAHANLRAWSNARFNSIKAMFTFASSLGAINQSMTPLTAAGNLPPVVGVVSTSSAIHYHKSRKAAWWIRFRNYLKQRRNPQMIPLIPRGKSRLIGKAVHTQVYAGPQTCAGNVPFDGPDGSCCDNCAVNPPVVASKQITPMYFEQIHSSNHNCVQAASTYLGVSANDVPSLLRLTTIPIIVSMEGYSNTIFPTGNAAVKNAIWLHVNFQGISHVSIVKIAIGTNGAFVANEALPSSHFDFDVPCNGNPIASIRRLAPAYWESATSFVGPFFTKRVSASSPVIHSAKHHEVLPKVHIEEAKTYVNPAIPDLTVPLNHLGAAVVHSDFEETRIKTDDVLQQANPRNHFMPMSTFRSFMVGFGNVFNAKNPWHMLNVIGTRYDNPAIHDPNLTEEGKTLARFIVDTYFSERKKPAVLTEAEVDDLIEKFLEDEKQKHYSKRFTAEGSHLNAQLKTLRLSLKTMLKPANFTKGIKWEGVGQGTISYPINVLTRFQIAWRLISYVDQMTDGNEENYTLTDNNVNVEEFEKKLQHALDQVEGTDAVTDFVMYDSKQGKWNRYMTNYYLSCLGIADSFIDEWEAYGSENAVLFPNGRTRITQARISGGPDTLWANGCTGKLIANITLRGVGPSVLTYKGDDASKRQMNMKVDSSMYARICSFSALRQTYVFDQASDYLGYIYRDGRLLPNIARMFYKATSHRSRDWDHFHMYQTSLKDRCRRVRQLGIWNCSAALMENSEDSWEKPDPIEQFETMFALTEKIAYMSKSNWYKYTKILSLPIETTPISQITVQDLVFTQGTELRDKTVNVTDYISAWPREKSDYVHEHPTFTN